MVKLPLLTATGVVSISSLTASCVVGGGGFLSTGLQLAALFTGLGYCYHGDRNPIRILGNLKIRVSGLEKIKAQLTQECEDLHHLKGAIASLNELESLIEQKHLELQAIEQQHRRRWEDKEKELSDRRVEIEKFLEESLAQNSVKFEERSQQLNQRQSEIEKFLEDERGKLNQWAEERSQHFVNWETQIKESAEQLETELEQDKQSFLRQQKAEVDALHDEIDLLRSQLAESENEIRRYEFPRMPEGVDREDVAARRVIEILRDCKLICDFRGAWIENGFVIVRVRPRRGGEREISKWANRIHIEMNLAIAPEISTEQGAVQLRLKPQELVSLSPVGNPISPNSEPDGDVEEPITQFIEPKLILDPHGPIRPLERRWVVWLWTCHNPPIRNKKSVIKRVWGATSGARMEKFYSARERLHQILDDANISYRKREG